MSTDSPDESVVAQMEKIAAQHDSGIFVFRATAPKRTAEQLEAATTTTTKIIRARHARAPDYQFFDAATISICEPKQMEATYFTPRDGPERIVVTVTAIGRFFKKGQMRKTRHYENIRAAISSWVPSTLVFNRIEIHTVPRYKMSELSGNEWRIRVRASFYNDAVDSTVAIYELFHHDSKYLLTSCAIDENPWEYVPPCADDRCDQEGCSEEANVTLKLKARVCESCSDAREASYFPSSDREVIYYRQFCNRHSRRGDCGIDDCDDNYITIENDVVAEQRQPPKPSDSINAVAE